MPISPMDEFLAHQTSDTFDYVATSDRNFYDRYYFNMHDSTGDFFMVAGMGQYPNLGVTDAFAAISHGTKQIVVRASRALGHDRLDTRVGPFEFEVIEGLKSLRIRCDENEWGLSFDVRFDGINAGRNGLGSSDIAAIVRGEILPAEPDLVVYYEGSNQFDLRDTINYYNYPGDCHGGHDDNSGG